MNTQEKREFLTTLEGVAKKQGRQDLISKMRDWDKEMEMEEKKQNITDKF